MSLLGFACIPVAVVVAYVPHGLKAALGNRALEKYGGQGQGQGQGQGSLQKWDNKNPRKSGEDAIEVAMKSGDERLAGKIRRCGNAHQNGMEGLTVFIGSVLMGKVGGVPTRIVDTVAIGYVLSRMVYTYLYVNGETDVMAGMRSTVFGLGLGANLYLMVKAAMSVGSRRF
jgi:uncharacterized MAPEG superfamily protein